jgi:flagellar hook-associated protein 3 FlgL
MRISPDLEQLVLSALNVSDQAEQTALQQMTTGRRVNQPSDDPAAAAMEVSIAYQMDSCDQFQRSISSVSSELQTADSSLNSAVTALQSAISLGVEGANSTLSQSNRNTLAQQVSGISQQVLSVANLSYNGHYVFAGTADSQPPYVANSSAPGGVEYQGNDDTNSVEIETGQSVVVNQPGSQLFSATGANVFQALSDLETALEDPTSTTEQIGAATNEVRNAYDQLTSARTFYGNTVDQMVNAQNFLSNEGIQLAQQQNSDVGVDMNVAATNLTNAEEARTATVEAAATLNEASLMDYLTSINNA